MQRVAIFVLTSLILALSILSFTPMLNLNAQAADSTTSLPLTSNARREGDWLISDADERGVVVMTRELTLHPQPEPQPALKHRLIPDEFDRTDGNAAIYYLKALGFFEETRARRAIDKFHSDARANVQGDKEPAPGSWLSMPFRDFPVDDAKEYLKLLSFQPDLLREATRRRRFSLDRDLRSVNNPIQYLLPEIQVMRELARTQRLRVRVAIAEKRIDDAIAIQSQQFSLANHLGTDEFLVSNLVGAAIATIGWEDALLLIEQPTTPNLYWAYAALPTPLIDMQTSMSYERQFLFEQVKSLREVDEQPRTVGYWQDFLDQFEQEIAVLMSSESNLPHVDDPQLRRLRLVGAIAAAYPGAKQFLVKECQLNEETVDAYPKVQTALLAAKRYYERARDEQFKWQFVPFSQAVERLTSSEQSGRRAAQNFGWISSLSDLLLPASASVRAAQTRTEQHIALLQTVESIRQYAAEHGTFPKSLQELHLPAVNDPFSGKPFRYEVNRDVAVLTGTRNMALEYRLVLRLAN